MDQDVQRAMRHRIDIAPETTHSGAFAAIVERGRVFGAQFHPEKSGDAGVRLLRNFVEITKSSTRGRSGSDGY